jgi:predicted nuclease with TOPRIM domain
MSNEDDPRISSIEVKIARIEERLNATDVTINDIKSRFDKIEQRLDKMDNRIWYIVTGIALSIGLQILFFLLRSLGL